MPSPSLFTSNQKTVSRSGHGVLLKRLIIIFAILTVLVIGLLAQKHFSTTRNISVSVITQITKQADNKIRSFFNPILVNTTLMKRWGQSDSLNIGDTESLNAKFIPILESVSQINSIMISTGDALEYVLQRGDKEWLVRSQEDKIIGGRQPIWHRLTHDGKLIKEWKDDQRRSPSDLAWFRGAVDLSDETDLYWTEPHTLFPGSDIGITAAVSWSKDDTHYASATNILLEDILQLIDKIKISDSSRFFLYAGKKVIIDFQLRDASAVASAYDSESLFVAKPPEDPVIASAMQIWKSREQKPEPFRFIFEKVAWWGLLIGHEESDNKVGIGILIPESDLIAQQGREKYLFVLVALGIFWIGLLLYARSYFKHERETQSHPNLVQASQEEILKAIQGGEHEKLEFKSTLRWNLKADKAGKEIELASLKTIAAFMNSSGGNLLVGVEDDGSILGTEADNFANDDKYLLHFSNIFNQHIGLEFAEVIAFALKPLHDKKIFVVYCRKSAKPVFVKHKNEESFYVRSGASSRELTPSQVLHYLKK